MVELDPLSPNTWYKRGSDHIFNGRMQAAAADLEQCERLGMPAPEIRAQIAFLERDLATVKAQCERPESDWPGKAVWRILYRAFAAYLEGNPQRVAAILAPLEDQGDVMLRYDHHLMALLRDDEETAVDHLAAAIERGEPFPLYIIQGTALTRMLFPEFYAGARYHALLKKLELDAESVARLSIPPLPFAPHA